MKKIKNFIIEFIRARKVTSVIILLVVLGIGYWAYAKIGGNNVAASYAVTNIKRGDVISTITGTGQVSASSQVEIKSKTSGDLTYLNTKANGTQITKGTLIAQIDTRDAAITLESARIAYQKAVKPADESDIIQAESTLNDAILSNQKSYEDAFSSLVNTFLDLPEVMIGLNDIIYGRTGYLGTERARSVGDVALNYRMKASISFDKAKQEYDEVQTEFKDISRTSATSTLEAFVTKTYLVTKDVSEALKNTQNAVEYMRVQKDDEESDTPKANISTWTSTVSSNASALLSSKTAMVSTVQDISKARVDLSDLRNGLDNLDLRSQQISLQQKENDYQNYFIRAPFDGLLAKLSVKPTDSVSSGTVIGTLVSSQKITTITLNEVDVSKVHVGQKAKLTFDAIDGLSIDGTVSTVDLIGTVSQGVVNYNVEIVLDTQDDRVKSGMSVSAAIIVEQKDNVLVVPNSAVKTLGNSSYVEMFTTPLVVSRGGIGTPSDVKPVQKKVVVGLSDDIFTEIVSGLNEGDQVVTRTIAGTGTTATKTTTPTIFGTGRAGASTGARMPRN